MGRGARWEAGVRVGVREAPPTPRATPTRVLHVRCTTKHGAARVHACGARRNMRAGRLASIPPHPSHHPAPAHLCTIHTPRQARTLSVAENAAYTGDRVTASQRLISRLAAMYRRLSWWG